MATNQDLTLDNDATHGQLLDERSRLAYDESVATQIIATAEAEESRIIGQALEEEKRLPTTSSNDATHTPADPKSAEKDVAVEAVGQTSGWIQVLQTGAAVTGESRTNDSNAADVAKGKKAGLVGTDAQSLTDISAKMQIKTDPWQSLTESANEAEFALRNKGTATNTIADIGSKAAATVKVQQVQGTLQNVMKNSYGIQAANKQAVAEIDHRLSTTPNAGAAPSVLGPGGLALNGPANGPKPPTHMTDEETVV